MKTTQFATHEDRDVHLEFKGKTIKFGVISDTHIGSKYGDLVHLKEFYKTAKESGAKFVLHAGDIVDGEGVYRGQDYEIYAHGFDEQLQEEYFMLRETVAVLKLEIFKVRRELKRLKEPNRTRG